MGKPAATDRPRLPSLSHSFTLDFVTTAPTREVVETYARPRLEKFLQERGLALSEAKTRIVHIKEGFNFLGFHIRKFGKQGHIADRPPKGKSPQTRAGRYAPTWTHISKPRQGR